MTLSKLSARNAKRQTKDYLVYFVTVVMAAALLYSFNGLVFSQEISTLSNRAAAPWRWAPFWAGCSIRRFAPLC